MFFRRRGQSPNIDDALQWAVERRLSVELAQSTYERCRALFGNRKISIFGTSQEWLAQATTDAQPMAEATTAQQLFWQQLVNASASAGGVPQTRPFEIDPNWDPKQLLQDAVESRQPGVLFEVGELQPMLNPSEADLSRRPIALHGGYQPAKAVWIARAAANGSRQSASVTPLARNTRAPLVSCAI